jgi:hypothetical protein
LDGFAFGLQQPAKGIGGFAHSIGHSAKRPRYHLTAKDVNPLAEHRIGQTAGNRPFADADFRRGVAGCLSGRQGKRQGFISILSAITCHRPPRGLENEWCVYSFPSMNLIPLIRSTESVTYNKGKPRLP